MFINQSKPQEDDLRCHLAEIFDRGARLEGDIVDSVLPLQQTASDDGDDAG